MKKNKNVSKKVLNAVGFITVLVLLQTFGPNVAKALNISYFLLILILLLVGFTIPELWKRFRK